ncbi:MAG: hypothetical protein NW224_27000 [Leptolyngbyaceae cyanobacterium bins.302]|nr:hypothetical protein [Leptolyngbyaceae cyanobacterium bins.302]
MENVSAYLDRETGEILLAPDMLPEELQNRRRFIKIPSRKIWTVNRQQAENWLQNTLQAFAQIYDAAFLQKAKFQLEQTFKNDDFSEKVHETIIELEREAFNR